MQHIWLGWLGVAVKPLACYAARQHVAENHYMFC